MNVATVMEDVMMIVLTLLVVSIVSVTVDMHFRAMGRLAMVSCINILDVHILDK